MITTSKVMAHCIFESVRRLHSSTSIDAPRVDARDWQSPPAVYLYQFDPQARSRHIPASWIPSQRLPYIRGTSAGENCQHQFQWRHRKWNTSSRIPVNRNKQFVAARSLEETFRTWILESIPYFYKSSRSGADRYRQIWQMTKGASKSHNSPSLVA